MNEVLNSVVSQILQEISDPELIQGGTGVYWEEFSFMERHGFDVAAIKPGLLYYIDEWERDHPEVGFGARENARDIALALRDIARSEANLPPLSDNQRLTWQFKEPSFRQYYWTGAWPTEKKLPIARKRKLSCKIIKYIKKNCPEAIRFATLAAAYNERLVQTGQPS